MATIKGPRAGSFKVTADDESVSNPTGVVEPQPFYPVVDPMGPTEARPKARPAKYQACMRHVKATGTVPDEAMHLRPDQRKKLMSQAALMGRPTTTASGMRMHEDEPSVMTFDDEISKRAHIIVINRHRDEVADEIAELRGKAS